MNPSSGSAIFQLLGNLTASLFGMILAFVNWYIVDQKTGGIIVFFWLFMMLYFYFAAKYPRFLVSIVAGAITHVLSIGILLMFPERAIELTNIRLRAPGPSHRCQAGNSHWSTILPSLRTCPVQAVHSCRRRFSRIYLDDLPSTHYRRVCPPTRPRRLFVPASQLR